LIGLECELLVAWDALQTADNEYQSYPRVRPSQPTKQKHLLLKRLALRVQYNALLQESGRLQNILVTCATDGEIAIALISEEPK
jgi:IS5 family transposase